MAARVLKAYDQGSDVDPDVWEQDAPESERQDYRREVARIGIVVDVLRKREWDSTQRSSTLMGECVIRSLTIRRFECAGVHRWCQWMSAGTF